MGSIIEWGDVMYVSAISRFPETSLIVGVNVVGIWWLCGRRSKFL